MGDSIYFINNFKVENVIFNNLESKLISVLEDKNI